MAKQTPRQKEVVGRVMHEFKHGELDRRDGKPVRNPKQAIAIALHEAGSSNQESPAKNRENLRKTERREKSGRTAEPRAARKRATSKDQTSREALYAEAKRRSIPGRSKMNKAQLEHALHT